MYIDLIFIVYSMYGEYKAETYLNYFIKKHE